MNAEELSRRTMTAWGVRSRARRAEIIARLLADLGIDPKGVGSLRNACFVIEQAIRFRVIAERGIVAGVEVEYEGSVRIVRKMTSAGFVLLEGVEDSVWPNDLRVMKRRWTLA